MWPRIEGVVGAYNSDGLNGKWWEMSLIERWGVAADRPATRARVGASYHTIWNSFRTRESPLLVRREKRRDVPVSVQVLARRMRERRKKKKRKRGRIVLARAINTRITISTTNVSFRDSLFVFSTLFFYPQSHDAYAYFLDIPFSLLNIILEQACSIRRLRSTRVILIHC